MVDVCRDLRTTKRSFIVSLSGLDTFVKYVVIAGFVSMVDGHLSVVFLSSKPVIRHD